MTKLTEYFQKKEDQNPKRNSQGLLIETDPNIYQLMEENET